MATENLDTILNKLYAMKRAKIVTVKEIANAIGEGPVQTSMWVMQRVRRPRADVAFKLQSFAAKQTLRIAASGRSTQRQYRAAYLAAQAMFPDEGRK